MKTSSAKAKGRRLQQFVRDAILKAFPSLTPDDVRSTSMGASGVDLLLSSYAKTLFPFDVECKNQEALNVWAALNQANRSDGVVVTAPLLVFKRNQSPVYVALQLDVFMALVQRTNGAS